MSWYPDRLIVANVAGRALLSDCYLVAEWRRDPWKGFDVPEGAWRRVKNHQYVPAKSMSYTSLNPADEVETEYQVRKRMRDMLARYPLPKHVVRTNGVPHETRDLSHRIVRFGDSIWVNQSLLRTLVSLIDGEPAEWRGSSATNPIHALDERGKWLGALMPIRLYDTVPTPVPA